VFAHTGGDVGSSHSWRAGLSYLATRAENREQPFIDAAGDEAIGAFTGKSRVAIADFVWKYAPNGNPQVTNFKLQGEYIRRKEKGTFNELDYDTRQSGWYLQSVYQFMPMWRVGARYDRLDAGDGAEFAPKRASVMVDWSPSEFSRVRLQYAQSKTLPGITDNQWFVQYILSLGAHGAHKY
jgi:outer membrane receptor protein involved in Fe transport